MSTCAIRYRLNAPGPSAFIVECNGGMRMYTRGTLGARMPEGYALGLTASRASRWVPASGELILDIELEDDHVATWDSVVTEGGRLAPNAAVDLGASGAMSA